MAGRSKKIELNATQIEKLTQWSRASSNLQLAKAEELELRLWLVNNSELFDKDKLEGSSTIEITNYPGWRLSADKVMNYTAVNDEGQMLKALNLIGSAIGADRPDLATALVKWKPELSTKAYRDVLPIVDKVEGLKAALAAAITIKPGTPQLELTPPKEETKIESSVPLPQQ